MVVKSGTGERERCLWRSHRNEAFVQNLRGFNSATTGSGSHRSRCCLLPDIPIWKYKAIEGPIDLSIVKGGAPLEGGTAHI